MVKTFYFKRAIQDYSLRPQLRCTALCASLKGLESRAVDQARQAVACFIFFHAFALKQASHNA